MNIARLLGQEAAKRGVKAYVRVTHPFYETPEKGTHEEKESIKPAGIRGVWWHETLRVLADIEKFVYHFKCIVPLWDTDKLPLQV